MELSWSSFILEIINFLVLIWLLKRFFYLPIQKTILKRKKIVQESLDKAENLQKVAQQLQDKYENRLQEWEKEKEETRKAFTQELNEWKAQELTRFEKNLEKEKDKNASQYKQYLSSIMDKNAKEAMRIAGQFAAKFLASFASQELEKKIVDKVVEDLEHLAKKKAVLLKSDLQEQADITIESAYQLGEPEEEKIIGAIHKQFCGKTRILFTQNPKLLAGLSIKIGSAFLQANLRDELTFFTEIENEPL